MHTIIFLLKSIQYIVLGLKDQYLEKYCLRSLVIGFGGGEDSTVLLQLVWSVVEKPHPEKEIEKFM